MKNTSAYAVLTRFGIIAAVLATLMLIAPAASAAPIKYSVPENYDEPIDRFHASDPEGKEITWKVDGEDKGDFEITQAGVLSFKEKPNFESPADADGDNVYKVTVDASGGKVEIEVTVTDVDEAGKVTINKPQPQVDRGLEASVSDPDSDPTDVKWQWSRGPNVDGPWTDIAKATSNSHNPVEADVDNYLRATATYTDEHGSGKAVSGISENTVEAKTLSNAAPKFADEDDAQTGTQVGRTVKENVKGDVGKPVIATDADNDILLYTITAGADKDCFSIDSRSGQLQTSKKLNFEVTTTPCSGTTNRAADDNDYEVTVTATDPSGAFTAQPVVVTVENDNDAPAFADATATLNQKEVTVVEGTTTLDGSTNANTQRPLYQATDEDNDTPITYAVTGADASKFSIASTGDTRELTFASGHTPDYESQSSYSISVTADDGNGGVGKVDITVKVTNANDDGTVKLSMREPQVGRPVNASLTDPDGNITGLGWQWYWDNDSTTVATDFDTAPDNCAPGSSALCTIDGAKSPTYTPKGVNPAGHDTSNTGAWFLVARATYSDKVGSDSAFAGPERDVQFADPANTAPKFPDDNDPNTPGNQADVEREVAENAKGAIVGDPITASDDDLLMYTIGGPDASSFEVGRDTGQITTAEELNYEAKKSYTVVLTTTDPSGAQDSTNVNVTVTDANDNGVITGGEAFEHDENDTGVIATFSATDEDGDDITWGVAGADAGKFKADGGELAFKDKPDYEGKADADNDNIYMVTVTANGGEHKVEVTLNDVDEPGKVTLNKPQPQIGRTLMASGEDADPDKPVDDAKWQWSRGPSNDGPWTDIDKATSASRTPSGDDLDMYLRATVTYNDKHGEGKTASAVSENPVEAKTLANAAPTFDHHPDGNTTLEGDQVTREVDENKKGVIVGKPVDARDADADILLYTIIDPDTNAPVITDLYSIDERSGQIKTKIAIDVSPGDGNTDSTDAVHTATVRATDPSGAFTDATVQITVKDVNDAPMFVDYDGTTEGRQSPPKTLYVTEIATPGNTSDKSLDTNTTGTDLTSNAYAVNDDDGETTFTYELDGPDKDKFNIDASGDLAVCTEELCGSGKSHDPDYEAKSSYSITIKGLDADKAAASIDVTVKVINAEDAGTVKLNRREPQVGQIVVATLSDPDGGAKGLKWQWYWDDAATAAGVDLSTVSDCTSSSTDLCKIPGATSPSYTPSRINAGNDETTRMFLTAGVNYTDAIVTDPDNDGDDGDTAHKATEAAVQVANPANSAPKFPDDTDPNTSGNQDTYEFSVDENAEAVIKNTLHSAVTATDADDDLLLYSLSGPDAASFTIVSGIAGPDDIGQIKTAEKFDYEKKTSYTIIATATDPSGASDSITVNVAVNDLDDPPSVRTNAYPKFAAATEVRSVAENSAAGAAVGDPVTASDKDVDVDADSLTYTMNGADASSFDIDAATGQISVGAGTTLDYETGSDYSVTVTATDEGNLSDSVAVTISVTDVNEAPTFAAATAERSVDENSAAGTDVGSAIMASDVDAGDTSSYSLSGDGAAAFAIDDMGQITVGADAMLDYETQTSYSVTVTVTDSGGLTDSIDVTVSVNDLAETPVFDTDTAEFSVDENMAAGTSVGSVSALHAESYSDDSDYFDVDGMGNITTTMMLDHEDMASHMVTVTATGPDGSTASIAVTVSVGDMYPGCTVAGNNGLTADCEALLDSKDALKGAGTALNWSEDTWANTWDTSKWGADVARWDGFQSHPLYPSLSGDPVRVTALHIQRKGLDGMIPNSLARLTELKALWIWGNSLHGDLSALGGMENLERAYVNHNELTGLGDVSGASSLSVLYAHHNKEMVGPLMAEDLPTSLTWLRLDGNEKLGGGIPDLSGLTNLGKLYLDKTGLTGSIPASLGSVSSLTHLRLKYNSLSGDIPAELGDLSNLVWLRINTAGSFTGCMPAALLDVASSDAAAVGLPTCAAAAP